MGPREDGVPVSGLGVMGIRGGLSEASWEECQALLSGAKMCGGGSRSVHAVAGWE